LIILYPSMDDPQLLDEQWKQCRRHAINANAEPGKCSWSADSISAWLQWLTATHQCANHNWAFAIRERQLDIRLWREVHQRCLRPWIASTGNGQDSGQAAVLLNALTGWAHSLDFAFIGLIMDFSSLLGALFWLMTFL
jgi:hypothetical protein